MDNKKEGETEQKDRKTDKKKKIMFAHFRTISGNTRQFNYRDESAGVCISAQCK